jgi:hypothetical protein
MKGLRKRLFCDANCVSLTLHWYIMQWSKGNKGTICPGRIWQYVVHVMGNWLNGLHVYLSILTSFRFQQLLIRRKIEVCELINPFPQTVSTQQSATCKMHIYLSLQHYRGRILGPNLDNSLRVFLLSIHSHLYKWTILPHPLEKKWFETGLQC